MLLLVLQLRMISDHGALAGELKGNPPKAQISTLMDIFPIPIHHTGQTKTSLKI
jgi:hypothetical protein